MPDRIHRALAALVLVAPAAAQAVLYDAGPAGSPVQAPDPVTQGWNAQIVPSAQVAGVSPDPDWPLNAWQVNDGGPGYAVYSTPAIGILQHPYEARFDVRMLAGELGFVIDTGDLFPDSLFEGVLRVVGTDVHVVGPTGALVCPGGADGAYHSYVLRGLWVTLSVTFDGTPVGDLFEVNWGGVVPGQRFSWGTAGAPAGRFRMHRASIASQDWGSIGTTYCSPAVPNSTGGGARIEALGVTLALANSLRLEARDMPPNQFGYFIASKTPAHVPGAGGSSGVLCVGGNVARFNAPVSNTGGAGIFWRVIDMTSMPTSPTVAVVAGDTWNFQGWFRDLAPGPTHNFTDAVSVTFD